MTEDEIAARVRAINEAFDALAKAKAADKIRPFLDAKNAGTAWDLSDEDFREFADLFFKRGTAGMRYAVAVETRAFVGARGCRNTVQLTDAESDELDAHLKKKFGERRYDEE